MNNDKLNKLIPIILSVSTFIIGIVLAFYVINFLEFPISDNVESWALFGNYFGGVLTPLLSIINIYVFAKLTITIQKITDKNNKENLETSKRIALMSMKHEELRNFKEEMDKNLRFWEDKLTELDRLNKLLYGYNVLEYRMLFLFPELRTSKNNIELRKYIVRALKYYEEGDYENAALCHIPISNIYGMLVSDLGKLTVK